MGLGYVMSRSYYWMSEWVRDVHVCHTNQIGATINNQSNCHFKRFHHNFRTAIFVFPQSNRNRYSCIGLIPALPMLHLLWLSPGLCRSDGFQKSSKFDNHLRNPSLLACTLTHHHQSFAFHITWNFQWNEYYHLTTWWFLG